MPITTNKILSTVQNAIGDIAMERIQPAEWVDMLNEIINDVSKETEIYLGRYITTPNTGIEVWVNNKSYAIDAIVEDPVDGKFYRCVGEFYDYGGGTVAYNINKPPNADVANLYWLVINQYSAATTYSAGQYVYLPTPLQFFKSKRGSNTDENPGVYGNASWEPVIISQEYTVTIPYTDPTTGQMLSPHRITRVIRSDTNVLPSITGENIPRWQETREYSIQAVGAQNSNNVPFAINDRDIGRFGFGTHFVDKNNSAITDGRTLVFATGFEVGEQVIIDFIQSQPFETTAWFGYQGQGLTPNVDPFPPYDIPDFLQKSYRWGLQWMAMETLFSRGDDTLVQRTDRAKQFYNYYLREAMGYSQMLLDKNSFIQSQPIIWLPK